MDVYSVYSGPQANYLFGGETSALVQGALDTGVDVRRLLPINLQEQ